MDRLERETEFHNQIFEDERRTKIDKFYAVTDSSRKKHIELMTENKHFETALEYGCGVGSYAYKLTDQNLAVTGIDISDYAIEVAKEKAKELNQEINFIHGNAEELDFKDDSFDLICGTAILHHLDLEKSYSEIRRVLKNNGRAVFWEPLGHNPFINLYRFLTPRLRTVDEHPLFMKDLKLLKEYFNSVKVYHFHMIDLPLFVFRNMKSFPSILKSFNKLERGLLKILPFLKRFSWVVVISLEEPKI